MSFSPDWLALRAPADAAARDAGLVALLDDWAKTRPGPLKVVDLGCGAGATFAALDACLPGADWLLLDNDPDLLEIAAACAPGDPGAGSVTTGRADLNDSIEGAVAGADLVTASALFDLASQAWIDRLVAALPKGAALYAALSYDGAESWVPAHEAEREAQKAFRAHQRRDKGFGGPALGPEAADALVEALVASGRDVRRAPSAWRLERPRDGALIEALAAGSAAAVAEIGTLDEESFAEWAAARVAAEEVLIGHEDILALPV
ncbi:class I SAM-dependent methyltransferase [Rhodovulum sp. DZ06]|uniref:class I SAM-dependent methyltransferase n=1 Tax=Rhodovulum sp. DZ06 TaxID=3425126 RepID=UPI003D34E146